LTTTQLGKETKIVITKLIQRIGSGMEIKRKKMKKKHMRNIKAKRKKMIRVKVKRGMITEEKQKDKKGSSYKEEARANQT